MAYVGRGTSGMPLIGQGAGIKPIFSKMGIEGGGTNSSSFDNSGIAKFNGTSLVTSTTATIDAADIMTNTSQPCFMAYNANAVANVTGDSTIYTCQFDTKVFDNANNFASNTFTAPVAGRYLFSAGISISNIGAAYTQARMDILLSSGQVVFPFLVNSQNVLSGGIIRYSGQMELILTASVTCTIRILVSGSTKSITWNGAAIGSSPPYFSGCLLC